MIRRALFVCTGNIFRSLAADVAVRRLLAGRDDIHVSSAGTVDYPHVVRPYTREYLLAKGFDVRRHQRRTLTDAIMDESHLVIAMSTDHQAFLRERYGREVPLYLEACGERAEWLPDIEDVVPDYQTDRVAVEAHVRSTIDRIVGLAPRMAENIDALLEKYGRSHVEPGMREAVRPARVGDAPEIAACVDAAYRHYIERLGKKPAPMLEDYAEAIRQHQVHVAEQGDRVVGALILMITTEGFLLHMIAVHPSAQGTGVGRMLLEFAEAEALRQGYRSIYLMTNEKMTENQVLYSKIGYAIFDRRVLDGYSRVVMRKELV